MRLQRAPRTSARRAFTLVEILIVVIILGILATIIIGLFANSTKDAAATSLKDNLRNVRSQLQLYMAQHGAYPTLAGFEAQMTQYSDSSGATSATKTATHMYGPYILQMPVMPVGTNKGKTGVTTASTYTAGFAWGYDATTGKFVANLPDTHLDTDGNKFNAY